jgi:hypothetical protein
VIFVKTVTDVVLVTILVLVVVVVPEGVMVVGFVNVLVIVVVLNGIVNVSIVPPKTEAKLDNKMTTKKLISVILPKANEEENIIMSSLFVFPAQHQSSIRMVNQNSKNQL